jgi:hypothetical protein
MLDLIYTSFPILLSVLAGLLVASLVLYARENYLIWKDEVARTKLDRQRKLGHMHAVEEWESHQSLRNLR